VGALYGILGAADHSEMRALGERLAHRGREAAQWQPGRDLHLGIRGTRRIVDVQEHGPVAFEGAIDNRGEIAHLLRRRDADAVGPAEDAGLVFELIDSLGPEGLGRLAGQFAVAFWHGPERRLLLARDRIGYAPLYFTATGDRFAFASEYKALLALEGVVARPNRDALQVVHATGWASPGLTCLERIFPVAPGSCLEVRAAGISSRRYWDIAVRSAAGSESDHAARLRDSLLGALGRQVAGYGRVGISLSGGLDSALVAAGARGVAEGREIHTFSAGYGPDDHHLANAAQVARALGTRHHAVVLDPQDLGALLPWMVWHLEEPVGGEEAGYLFAATREAGRHVTLVLTGFGFDGLFGGLARHRMAQLALKYPALRAPLGELYDHAYRGVPPASLGGRALRAAYYRRRDVPSARVRGAAPLPPVPGFSRGGDQPLSELLRRDLLALPYQSSFERLYAGAGIRVGAPHTDPEFVETAFSIPDRLKTYRDQRKGILRKACAPLLAMSFASELRNGDRAAHELRWSDALDGMAVELLSPGAVVDRELFEPAYVTQLLRRGRGQPYGPERSRRIWSLLLTEIWARSFLDRAGSAPEHAPPPVRRLEDASLRSESAASTASAPHDAGRPAS
jgi:asparagine synthase (glutamine-hydrolysing)